MELELQRELERSRDKKQNILEESRRGNEQICIRASSGGPGHHFCHTSGTTVSTNFFASAAVSGSVLGFDDMELRRLRPSDSMSPLQTATLRAERT